MTYIVFLNLYKKGINMNEIFENNKLATRAIIFIRYTDPIIAIVIILCQYCFILSIVQYKQIKQ